MPPPDETDRIAYLREIIELARDGIDEASDAEAQELRDVVAVSEPMLEAIERHRPRRECSPQEKDANFAVLAPIVSRMAQRGHTTH